MSTCAFFYRITENWLLPSSLSIWHYHSYLAYLIWQFYYATFQIVIHENLRKYQQISGWPQPVSLLEIFFLTPLKWTH